ncbi:hypothetical protein AMAG_10546 [Allomyces macrogynus ATCC 38327]|uniref:mannose-1-phosphate guanylyltransferase n=1 Tax=Allomyces macrogynus (strain ATCC 38327) TaxID=578462 RepID=A0A0L0SUR1_ALLM3|nr:hypothetical protein AMAG_10546 [Allomyces macrogynus ATCC 38327]|eukprot:KNE66323.1 hypothetical protein AMAG_10546 [Allomyces macrogynus ATCC 38327]
MTSKPITAATPAVTAPAAPAVTITPTPTAAAPPQGPIKAVILVGGPSRGTRFRPLSLNVPKPLFPIANQPLLYHHLAALADVPGLRDVALIGFFEDAVFAPFLDRVHVDFPTLNVRYLREYQALGTAGGIFHFRDELLRGDPRFLFVLHSDIVSSFPLQQMVAAHAARPQGALCTMLATRVPAETTQRYGCIVAAADGQVLHYVEKPEFYISDLINGGVYLFDTAIFNVLAEIRAEKAAAAAALAAVEWASSRDSLSSYDAAPAAGATQLRLEHDVFKQLAGTKKLFAYESHEIWTQLKSATSAVLANTLVLQHNKRRRSASICVESLKGPQVVGAVSIHRSAQIHPTAKIGPNVSVGPRATVGPGVRIKDAIILDGVDIKANACILSSVIGWNSKVGKWARVEGTPTEATAAKLMDHGHKTQTSTVIGHEVTIADEVIIRNCIVLPHKELKASYRDDILL